MGMGQILPLSKSVIIRAGNYQLHFRPLKHSAFMGLVLGEEESSASLAPGVTLELGREPV